MSPPAGPREGASLSRGCLLALLVTLTGPVDRSQAQGTRDEAMPRSFVAPAVLAGQSAEQERTASNRLKWTAIGAGAGAVTGYLLSGPLGPYAEGSWRRNWTLGGAVFGALAGLILSAPDDSDRDESPVGSVSTFIPPSGDSAPEQTFAVGAGTFIGFAGTDVALLHLLASYERRLSSHVQLVAEGGFVTYEDNLFVAIAPSLKLVPTSDSRSTLFARAGPAFFGTSSGGLVLVHVGAGIDLSGASNGVRLEARTYVSPGDVSFDLLEVIVSYRFDPGPRGSSGTTP